MEEKIIEEQDALEKNYLEQIEALKNKMATMVPGDKYNAAVAEHKRLTDEYINKRPVEKVVEVKPRALGDITKDLRKSGLSNLDHIKLSLEYRDTYIKTKNEDPWTGGSVDHEDAENLADYYRDLIKNYGDNPSEFTYRFNDTLKDDPRVLRSLSMRK